MKEDTQQNAMKAPKPRSILLEPRNPGPNIAAWSARPRRIAVIAERDRAWLGRPVANPKCPTLLWPKCAWVEVPPVQPVTEVGT